MTKSYQEVIGNRKIEDFKSSLSLSLSLSLYNKLPTQEEEDMFNKKNGHQTAGSKFGLHRE